MNRVVLQVPLTAALRKDAQIEAKRQGFSSLQDAVRMFLSKLATKRIGVSFKDEEAVYLSSRAIKRYNKAMKDIEEGKNVYKAKDVDDLMRQLHEP